MPRQMFFRSVVFVLSFLMAVGVSAADYALELTVFNNSGFDDTEIYLTAPGHKPLSSGVDDDSHWGYIDFSDTSAPVFVDTGSAADFELDAGKMSFRLDHFKDDSGNYTVNFCEIGGGRLYFAFGDNFDQCGGGFSSSGPLTNDQNTVVYDMMEFFLNPEGTPVLDISRVDFFGVSFYFSTTDVNTGKIEKRGHVVSRDKIIESFSGYPDSGGVVGNTALFNILTIIRDEKDGVSDVRVTSPKNLSYAHFEGKLAKGAQICSHFYQQYVTEHCWKPGRTFTSYDKNNYRFKSPVYYCKVSEDGAYLNIYTDSDYTTAYSPLPKMTRPCNTDASFPAAGTWHQTDNDDPNKIDWGFVIMGSVNPASGAGKDFGSDPVAMYIMAALARGVLHRDDPDQWLTNVLAGNPATGASTTDYPIFYYGKILHDNSIDGLMYALSYDDVGGQDATVAIPKTDAKAKLFFNPVKSSPASHVSLTMAVNPDDGGTTDPPVNVYADHYVANTPIPISATAAEGYHFTEWSISGDGSFADDKRSSTTVSLAGDATVTAGFAADGDQVTLTMAVGGNEGGTTDPAVGAHTVNSGQSVSIEATADDNYHFVRWEGTANAKITDSGNPESSAVIDGDATVTAVFADQEIDRVAVGSVIEIDASELGGENVTEFSGKPKVYVEYTDPVKNKEGVKGVLKVVTKVGKKTPAAAVDAEWTKKISLYNKKNFKDKSKSIEDLLKENPLLTLSSDAFYVKYKEVGKATVELDRCVELQAPVCLGISGDHDKAGDVFTLSGRYFGAKPPKVSVEVYTEKKGVMQYKLKKCKLLKKDSTGASYLKFKNAKGKDDSSCMKIYDADNVYNPPKDVGYSEVTCEYPKINPDKETATGYMVIDNQVGIAVFRHAE